ncbi:MAG: TetR/AcrR family transcriptional regulator [Actinobacteria bacterium]|nr:MAG: TetR/AcrR family transcriptional regulator [Actinomycetota bacterium]
MGLREDKKRRQRREIVEIALELFRERGYDQTRVSDIAERAVISEATFFNYFPSKDLVLDELALAQVELFSETLRYELANDGVSVPERLRETLRVAATAIAADREFQTVLYTRSNLFHSDGVLKQRTHEMYGLLSGLFALGQGRGEIRGDADPMQLAEILLATYHLTTINWLTGWWGGRRQSLQRRVAAATEILLDGCAVQ